jgi:hypothetical protein
VQRDDALGNLGGELRGIRTAGRDAEDREAVDTDVIEHGEDLNVVVGVAETEVELRLAEAVALDGDDAQLELLAARSCELSELECLEAGAATADEDDRAVAGVPLVDVVGGTAVAGQ